MRSGGSEPKPKATSRSKTSIEERKVEDQQAELDGEDIAVKDEFLNGW